MQIIKTCNKHGVLSPENINLRLRRNSNPNHNPIWYEKTCGLCKKDKDKTEYNNLPRFNERKDYWTHGMHKLRVYSLQMNSLFKKMAGNTKLEFKS